MNFMCSYWIKFLDQYCCLHMERGGISLLPAGLSVWQFVDGGGGGSAHPNARKENTCPMRSRAVHCRAIAEYVAVYYASTFFNAP